MVSRQVAVLLVSLLAVLSLQGQPKSEKEQLKPQTPEDSMRQFVVVLAEKDAWKAEQTFVSKATYANTFPPQAPPHAGSLLRLRKSLKAFLAQPLAIEKMKFVRIDFANFAQPMLVPKGFRGFRRACVMYDNLHVTVGIDGKLYSFKTDELVADADKWALMDGIGLLRPYQK